MPHKCQEDSLRGWFICQCSHTLQALGQVRQSGYRKIQSCIIEKVNIIQMQAFIQHGDDSTGLRMGCLTLEVKV